MRVKIILFLLLIFSFTGIAQNNNFHVMMPVLDGSFVEQGSSSVLKVKIDERYTDYVMNLSDIKVYRTSDSPISGFITAINNRSASGANIKRGTNMLELTLNSNQSATYYILEIPNSKGEKTYMRFYFNSGVSGSGPGGSGL